MIVHRRRPADSPSTPSEIHVYLTTAQLAEVTRSFAATDGIEHLGQLSLRAQRDYCRELALSSRSRFQRTILAMEGARLDSAELGHDLVSRFQEEESFEAFNPDLHDINLTFCVFERSDEPTVVEFYANPQSADPGRLEPAFAGARQIVTFCVTRPD